MSGIERDERLYVCSEHGQGHIWLTYARWGTDVASVECTRCGAYLELEEAS